MNIEHKQIAAIALEEAGAIMRSWGYRFAALAPLALFLVVIGAIALWSSSDPRRALVVETQMEITDNEVVSALSRYIGPHVPQTELRDAQAGLWIPVASSSLINGQAMIGGVIIDVGAHATIRSTGDSQIAIDLQTDNAPQYIMDLLHIAVMEVDVDYNVRIEHLRHSMAAVEPVSLSASLLHLVTILLAAATGALGAAASHALTTAYLAEGGVTEGSVDQARSTFLGKLIGIGCAYAALAIPWGFVGALAITGLSIAGDPELSLAMLDVASELLQPSRLLVFLVGALSGYVVYAALVLLLALRAKTAAAARTLTGPATIIAVAPAPIALWAQNTNSEWLLEILTWLPITAPAALQLRVSDTAMLEISLPLMFLVFVAVCALRIGSATAVRGQIASQ
ncbi:MAG: hypothetical protein AAGJ09_05335 [Pseudomonadota bacterium]